jgi:hypothetical protein
MSPSVPLAHLVPLVNDTLSDKAVTQRLRAFLNRLDASGLRLPRQAGMWDVYGASTTELHATQKKLRELFDWGFRQDLDWDEMMPPLSYPSVRYVPTQVDERWTLVINAGRLRDLVPFVAMWLLTYGDTHVGRCTAPRPRAWNQTCGRYFVSSGVGRPRQTCSAKCALRAKNKQKHQHMKELLREESARRRKLRKDR